MMRRAAKPGRGARDWRSVLGAVATGVTLFATPWQVAHAQAANARAANAQATNVQAANVQAVRARSAGAGSPPGYTSERKGDSHDFDYFQGAWTTTQRRLKARGVGSSEWEEFPATLCMTLYLEGIATVDEIWFPTKQWAGLTLRTFDLGRKQWSIYWVSSASGKLESPVVGGFAGPRGEFYGEDRDDGRPIKVRYTWLKVDNDHARWEQAFSYDDRTWETNWTADFIRADASKTCERGRPSRPPAAS